LPDTDAIAFNPDDGLLYHTAGSESWSSNPDSNGFRDHQYLETFNLATGEFTPIFNANPCPSPDALPCFGLPAPRPSWVELPEVRLAEQIEAEYRVRGENEYHALRHLAWSESEKVFYGTDENGIFTLTPDGESTFVGDPGSEIDPKAIAFAQINGETRLLVGDKENNNLWEIDPVTAQIVAGPVDLFYTDNGADLGGLLGLAQHPETGELYGINKTSDPLDRELVRINPETGETDFIGFLEVHMASLTFVYPGNPVVVDGDFNSDGVVDRDDLDLLGTEIAAGTNDVMFDLNADALVDTGDRDEFLGGDLITTGNKLNGDADFDGEVQFSDFVILSNSFGNPGVWSDGDFDVDGVVQFGDFVILSNNFGLSAAAAAVPEPAGIWLALVGLLVLVRGGRCQRLI
jgi:hypothetical protein